MAFWKWREMVVYGDLEKARQPCTITMYDRTYKPIITWNLINAWPSKISGISVKADSNDFVVEEMVITHEGIKREGAEGYPTVVK
jgi:phage tail-like protein